MNDMREYIKLVESQELDEAGGIIDRLLSKLPGKMGSRAGGRVDKKEMFKLLRNAWIKYSASTGEDEQNPDAIKDFLHDASLSDEQIESIPGLKKQIVDVDDVFSSAAELVNMNAGPALDDKKTSNLGREKKIPKVSASGSSSEDINKTFKKLGGNAKELKAELRAVKHAGQLQGSPLAMLGYTYSKAVEKK